MQQYWGSHRKHLDIQWRTVGISNIPERDQFGLAAGDFQQSDSGNSGTYVCRFVFCPGWALFLRLRLLSSTGVDNSPLHALMNGVDGPDGVYAYAASNTFPTSTFGSSNYWVDVIFTEHVGSCPAGNHHNADEWHE